MENIQEQSKQEQNKGDKVDMALTEMYAILNDLGDMYARIKKVKYNYLIQTCDLLTRVDHPSIMMDVLDKEIKQTIPSAESIRKGHY